MEHQKYVPHTSARLRKIQDAGKLEQKSGPKLRNGVEKISHAK